MIPHIYLKITYEKGKALIGSWAPPTELNDAWDDQKDIGWHVSLALFNGAKSVEVKLGNLDEDESDELEKFRSLLITAESLLCDPVAGNAANDVSAEIIKALNGDKS